MGHQSVLDDELLISPFGSRRNSEPGQRRLVGFVLLALIAAACSSGERAEGYSFQVADQRKAADFEDEIIDCMRAEGIDMPYGMLAGAGESTVASEPVLVSELVFGLLFGVEVDQLTALLDGGTGTDVPISYDFLGSTPFEVYEEALYGSEIKRGCVEDYGPQLANSQAIDDELARATAMVDSVSTLWSDVHERGELGGFVDCLDREGLADLEATVIDLIRSSRGQSTSSGESPAADRRTVQPQTSSPNTSVQGSAVDLTLLAGVVDDCDVDRSVRARLDGYYRERLSAARAGGSP